MKDSLGDRIKTAYEDCTRIMLPRRTNLIIRVDGKAFHTFTRNCKKPYDDTLIDCMNATAVSLCKKIQGAKAAYVQSDEISIFVTDYDNIETCAWFGNNLQKIVSVSASIATATFNTEWLNYKIERDALGFPTFAEFDARAFTIQEKAEVANYFLWRTQDATRNSIQMLARSLFSHKELEGVGTGDLKQMCSEAGSSWDALPNEQKHGRIVFPYDGGWAVGGVTSNTFKFWYDVVETSTKFTTETI